MNIKIKFLAKEYLTSDIAIIVYISVAKLLIHLYSNAFANYGIFRDELYYIACSKRLDIGYVDQPPLASYIMAFSRMIIGDSVFAIRSLPAIASAMTVFVTGAITRELGGKRFAVTISCLAVTFSLIHLAMFTFFSMNAFDILFWTISFYLVIKLIKGSTSKLWLLLGVLMGLGLMNKITFLWFGLGLFVGLLATVSRKELKTARPFLACLIALFIFLPYIIWNIQNDFAHLEFIRTASAEKYSSITPVDFILGQFLINNPAVAPVWLAGLYFFFFNESGKKFKLLGFIFLTSFTVLVVNWHSKPEYLSPAMPILFASGGVMLELISYKKYWNWIKYTITAFVIVFGIVLMPVVLPILPPQTYIAYSKSLGIAPSTAEGNTLEELPQFYADMFGWEEFAKTISKVYLSLPIAEQKDAIVVARNYGQAGAIEYYSSKYPLPKVISPHNNFWIWSKNTTNIKTVIIVGGTEDGHREAFDEVEMAAIHKCEYCMPYENNRPIFICRKFKLDFKTLWQRVKIYI